MENEKITIELPLIQWNIVITALTKRPFEEVVQTIQDIKAQADAQIQASQQTVETESQPS